MRAMPIPRRSYRDEDCGLAVDSASYRNNLRYWPLELDLHISRLANLPKNAVDRWHAYLSSLPLRHLATERAAAATEGLWNELSEELEAPIPPPNASPTDDAGVLMSWQLNGHHLEIEVMPDGAYEWFYRHRVSDMDESGSDESGEVSDRLLVRLREVFQ